MKPWYKSRTLWFNALSGVAALLLTASEQQLFGVSGSTYAMAIAFVNVALRFVTSDPITLR
jgi:hypothetical protein